jgi:hypothetical protein
MNITLNINQTFKLISTNGVDKTFVVEGPIGSGKSSLAKLFDPAKYNIVTVDCTQWDVGDVQIPSVDKERRVVEFLPNVLLVGDGTKPMVINFDEIGKASRPVQNALLPVMLERRVGAVPLPAGSIVFGTTNLGAEGVGDLFQAHACNRVSFIEMRPPTADEWVDWALQNQVNEAMLAWAKEEQSRLFGTFKDFDNPADFPYGFHPKDKRRSFVTPRSLYLASIELREDRRAAIDDPDITLAAIAGNIGARAALDLMAFVKLADKLPAWATVINTPDKAVVPDNAAAMMMTVYRAVMRTTEDTLDNVMTYVQRLPKEMQCVFAVQLLRSRKPWAGMNSRFTAWCRDNVWLMK